MTDWAIWFVLAGVLIGAELFSGTFYLLMIALGLAAGGISALSGVTLEWQLLVAAVVGVAAVLLLRRGRLGRRCPTDVSNDPNVILDIGQTLDVPAWQEHGSQYLARVPYRGALWDVQLQNGHHPVPGNFIIREIRGSRLIVAPH